MFEIPLSDDLIAQTFRFLPPAETLQSVCAVNQQFSRVVRCGEFWKTHPLLPNGINSSGNSDFVLSLNQIQRICILESSFCLDTRPPPFLNEGSVLPKTAEIARLKRKNRLVCTASTTDNWSESLENTLISIDNNEPIGADNIFERFDLIPLGFGVRKKWWSSLPSSDPNSNETLLYTTRFPLVLMTSVQVKALEDPFVRRAAEGLIYAWNRTIIRAYRIPLHHLTDEEDNGFPCSFPVDYFMPISSPELERTRKPPRGQLALDRILKNATLVYEGAFDDNVEDQETHTFKLPKGVVANVLTLELVGKRHEQQSAMGYFACIEHIDCIGIPL